VKSLSFDLEASKNISSGIDKVAEAVGATLGPRGRHIVIERPYQAPLATNDGVTVALNIELPDAGENVGVKLVREAASKTNDSFGDGTTTTTIMTQKMVRDGIKLISAGVAPILLKKGMDSALRGITEIVAGMAEPCDTKEKVKHVAYVSSHQDEPIANVVADAVELMGARGVIEVLPSDLPELKLEVTEGCMIDRGFAHPHFLSPGETSITLEEPAILILDKKWSNIQELGALGQVLSTSSLLVIAEDIEGAVLQSLLVTNARGAMKVCAVKAPSYGDHRAGLLADLAILTGTTVISSTTGLSIKSLVESITSNGDLKLGCAQKVLIDKDNTTFVKGYGKPENIQARILALRNEAELRKDESYNYKQLLKRASSLESGIATIRIGGATKTTAEERKLRLDDALSAARAASESGIVAGGGVALLNAAKVWETTIKQIEEQTGAMNPDVKLGHDLVIQACATPLWQIVENAGESGDYAVKRVQESPSDTLGFDASDLTFKNLPAAGILDPASVVVAGLRNAVSIASMTLSVGCLVTDEEENEN